MIMAGTRPWGVVWALGSLPALTGPWHAGQMPAAFPPSLRRFVVIAAVSVTSGILSGMPSCSCTVDAPGTPLESRVLDRACPVHGDRQLDRRGRWLAPGAELRVLPVDRSAD